MGLSSSLACAHAVPREFQPSFSAWGGGTGLGISGRASGLGGLGIAPVRLTFTSETCRAALYSVLRLLTVAMRMAGIPRA